MAQFSISKGKAYTSASGVVNDSIGRVSYAYKENTKILLENLTADLNNTLVAPNNDKSIKVKDKVPNNLDCFYKYLSTKSVYTATTTVDSIQISAVTVPDPTINFYRIKLAENIYTLEIRNNDPWTLTGLDAAPLDIFESLAITNDEVQSIKTIISTKNLQGYNLFFKKSLPEAISTDGYRTYYKTRLSISVSSKSNPPTYDTTIDLFSVDAANWVSVAYANAVITKVPGVTWDNQIIPTPVSGNNPFTTTVWASLTSKLNTIVTEANSLPVSIGSKGSRLVTNTAIRDYIYQGNIDRVTFEMAFRLPFYLESKKDTPYENVTLDTTKTGKFNNPYYTKFDEWFGYANNIRTAASLVNLKESGRPISDYNSGYHDYNPKYLDLLMVSSTKERSLFISDSVPCYMAKNFDFENEDYSATADVPYPAGSITIQGDARDLNTLVSSHIISTTTKSGLENGTIKYAMITDGTYAGEEIKNGFVSFKKNKAKKDKISHYYISIFSWNDSVKNPNSSGLTFGYGYDFGKNTGSTDFTTYTGITIPTSGTAHDAILDAKGATKIHALRNWLTYYDSVWNTKAYQVPVETAVPNTVTLMKGNKYLGQALKYIAKDYINNGVKTDKLYLRTYQPSFADFFNGGPDQFLNEVEKVYFVSQTYNPGPGCVDSAAVKNPSLRFKAKRAIQAFNTHDIRYLKYALNLSLISHRNKIINMLNAQSIYNYFRNIN